MNIWILVSSHKREEWQQQEQTFYLWTGNGRASSVTTHKFRLDGQDDMALSPNKYIGSHRWSKGGIQVLLSGSLDERDWQLPAGSEVQEEQWKEHCRLRQHMNAAREVRWCHTFSEKQKFGVSTNSASMWVPVWSPVAPHLIQLSTNIPAKAMVEESNGSSAMWATQRNPWALNFTMAQRWSLWQLEWTRRQQMFLSPTLFLCLLQLSKKL